MSKLKNLKKRNLLKTSKKALKQIEDAKRMGLLSPKKASELTKQLKESMEGV